MRLRDSDLTWQEIDEEIIVLDLKASSYLKLNGTGAHLWKQLESGADVAGLVSSLVGAYEVDEATARRDVDAFLRQLSRAQLLTQEG